MPRPARRTGTTTTSAVSVSPCAGSMRCFHTRQRHRQLAGGLDGQEQAEPMRQPAEVAGCRRPIAQRQQGILSNRVLHQVYRHGRTIHASSRILRMRRPFGRPLWCLFLTIALACAVSACFAVRRRRRQRRRPGRQPDRDGRHGGDDGRGRHRDRERGRGDRRHGDRGGRAPPPTWPRNSMRRARLTPPARSSCRASSTRIRTRQWFSTAVSRTTWR